MHKLQLVKKKKKKTLPTSAAVLRQSQRHSLHQTSQPAADGEKGFAYRAPRLPSRRWWRGFSGEGRGRGPRWRAPACWCQTAEWKTPAASCRSWWGRAWWSVKWSPGKCPTAGPRGRRSRCEEWWETGEKVRGAEMGDGSWGRFGGNIFKKKKEKKEQTETEQIKYSCICSEWRRISDLFHHVGTAAEALRCMTSSLLTSSRTFSPRGWCPPCTGWPSTRPAAAGRRCWRRPSGCWSPCSRREPPSSPWWSGSCGWAAGWGVRRCGLQRRTANRLRSEPTQR